MVSRLGVAQRDKLSRHRDRAHWKIWGQDRFYIERLLGEVLELQEAILQGAAPERVWGEAADIANFAAMRADRHEERIARIKALPPAEERGR